MLGKQEKARAGTREVVLNVLLPGSPVVYFPWAMAGGQYGYSLPGGWPQPAAMGL